jgi:hypothetical protein
MYPYDAAAMHGALFFFKTAEHPAGIFLQLNRPLKGVQYLSFACIYAINKSKLNQIQGSGTSACFALLVREKPPPPPLQPIYLSIS